MSTQPTSAPPTMPPTTPPRLGSRPPALLDPGEVALLASLASGMTAQAAARQANVSPRTLRRRMQRIYSRTGATTSIQAAVWAAKHDLI